MATLVVAAETLQKVPAWRGRIYCDYYITVDFEKIEET